MADGWVRPTRQSSERSKMDKPALISWIMRLGLVFAAIPNSMRTTVTSNTIRARIPATIPTRTAPAAQSLPVTSNTTNTRMIATLLPKNAQSGRGLGKALYQGVRITGRGPLGLSEKPSGTRFGCVAVGLLASVKDACSALAGGG